MKIKSTCKSLSLITAIIVMLTVFAAFCGAGAVDSYAAAETKMNIAGTVTNGPLNVRSGPGTGYKKLGTIAKGKNIIVLTKQTNSKGEVWYKYKFNTNKNGYISAKYVKLKETFKTDKVTSFNRKAVIKSQTLKVRAGAGTIYSHIGTLKKGEVVYITKKIKKRTGKVWYRFSYDGANGYVNSEYIKLTKIVSETDLNRVAVVKEGPLNVRSGPGTDYSKLGAVNEGDRLQAVQKIKMADGSQWYKYRFSSTKYGYVSAEYIELTNIVSEKTFTRKGIVKSGPLKVREKAGSDKKQIGSLKKGKAVYISKSQVLISGVKWYEIKYDDKTAYVNGNYIELTDIISESVMNKKSTIMTSCNVRSGPHKDYKNLGKLSKGTIITVVAKIKNTDNAIWYKFKFDSDTYGYVYGGYVQLGVGVTFKVGTVTTDSGISLNVRSGAGTGYSKLGSLPSGSVVTVLGSAKADNGKVWYKYQFSSGKLGWICSDYVKVKTITSEPAFENYLEEQGFPDSYKPALRALKNTHPNWVFTAYDVGCTWKTAVNKENAKPGLNVIDTSLPKSWRSKDSDCYNSKTGVWSRYDGRWYSAHTDVIRYYLDPRNFLNEDGIYQFLTHKYNGETQSTETVKAVVDGTFMETREPGNGWSSFATLINAAGKNSGVNPNVLAAMIIQEQGSKGTSGLISGTYSGYKGYYNFLNIGAYTTSTMTAVQRGLWYAKKEGWNTEYKSIKGGADIYHDNYVERNQYTFYTKKFNVMNGTDKIGSHQYMTNVQGAYGEAQQLKKAFPDNYSKALTFIIPVYDSMPVSPCDLP